MNRLHKISEIERFVLKKCRKLAPFFSRETHELFTSPSSPIRFARAYAAESPSQIRRTSRNSWTDILDLFAEKWMSETLETTARKNMIKKVNELREDILKHKDDADKIEKALDEDGVSLFRRYPDGSAVMELLHQLQHCPRVAIEVLNWRRKQLDIAAPMTEWEYSKGIVLAGRSYDVALAVELFDEACNKQLKETSFYNALMSAYLYNGQAMKCQSIFQDLKMDSECVPTIVTYDILISAFGGMMLVDHMEAAHREIKELNLQPTINTYRGLIAGYITAWMWEEMEKTYLIMKAGPIKPNSKIHLLMLRGYALSGKLEKMEEMYEMVRDNVDHKEFILIRTMITAYCRSSDIARVSKVEKLLKLIPENEYRPWLNVLLICLYAKENLVDRMESSIDEAFRHNTCVTTVGVMRLIISSYFRQRSADKLAEFLRRADAAGWKRCQSLYHCKMVMYSSEKRLTEMERVIDEMDEINMPLSKKTFWILYKAYRKWGEQSKLEQVMGLMCKSGYQIDLETGDL